MWNKHAHPHKQTCWFMYMLPIHGLNLQPLPSESVTVEYKPTHATTPPTLESRTGAAVVLCARQWKTACCMLGFKAAFVFVSFLSAPNGCLLSWYGVKTNFNLRCFCFSRFFFVCFFSLSFVPSVLLLSLCVPCASSLLHSASRGSGCHHS